VTAASHPSSASRRAVAVILQQLTLTAIQQLQGTIALSSSSPILQILTASSALWYPQFHPTKSIPYDFASWIQRILSATKKGEQTRGGSDTAHVRGSSVRQVCSFGISRDHWKESSFRTAALRHNPIPVRWPPPRFPQKERVAIGAQRSCSCIYN